MSALLPRSRKPASDNLPALIGAFESETQAVIARTAPYSERAILHGVAILVVVAVVLMCLLKLDRVVVATGRVVPTAGALYIQTLDRAMVRSIAVRVGDVVRRGQVLAVLDPTFAGADAATLENKRASDAALVARLEAEQAARPYVPQGNDPASMLQLATWRQRQAEYRQGLADFDARIASSATLVTRASDDVRTYGQHLQIASDLERRMQELENSGYGATIKTLSARDGRVEADRQLSEARGQAAGGAHDLAALRAQRAVYVNKWQDDIGAALVLARNDLNQSTQDLIKAKRVRDLTSLTAPADAVVLQIGNASAGSVVDTAPGGSSAPLFVLTPLGGAVEADVDIPASDVGFVKRGDKVRIKLDAYRFMQHGTAEGVVKTISEGSFTTDEDQQKTPTHFKGRIAFTKVRLRNVPADFRLIPGMTLSGDILIGRRTIMSYVVEGALKTGAEAMREP
jgi:hemolysin D